MTNNISSSWLLKYRSNQNATINAHAPPSSSPWSINRVAVFALGVTYLIDPAEPRRHIVVIKPSLLRCHPVSMLGFCHIRFLIFGVTNRDGVCEDASDLPAFRFLFFSLAVAIIAYAILSLQEPGYHVGFSLTRWHARCATFVPCIMIPTVLEQGMSSLLQTNPIFSVINSSVCKYFQPTPWPLVAMPTQCCRNILLRQLVSRFCCRYFPLWYSHTLLFR